VKAITCLSDVPPSLAVSTSGVEQALPVVVECMQDDLRSTARPIQRALTR
jgi:hypothetical protein